jgi:hypothetical protein
VACASPAEVARAAAARAPVLALCAGRDGRVNDALWPAVPSRTSVLVLPPDLLEGESAPVDPTPLRGRADALLDLALAATADPAAELRRLLAAEGA